MSDIIDALNTYRAEFPANLDVLAQACFGRFGYGDGRVLSGNVTGPALAQPVAGPDGRDAIPIVGGCSACERRSDCWQAMREKARELMPRLMVIEDAITAEGHGGMAFIREWQRATGQQEGDGSMIPPPSMLLNVENMQHGTHHAAGLRYEGPRA